jgi:hypothetical protein
MRRPRRGARPPNDLTPSIAIPWPREPDPWVAMLLVSGMRADARAHRLARLAADRAAARSYGEPAITTATQSWDIYLVRPKAAKWIGTVEAADSDSAIEDAAKLDHCDLEAGRWQLLCEDAAGPAMPTMRMSTGGSFVATQVLPRPQFFAFSAVICTKSETNRCGMSGSE